MGHKHGPWTIEETTRLYQNSFIEVLEDRVVQPDGEQGTYATVAMKPGIAVLPVDGEGRVYLVKQFRYALGRESLEVVCGAMDEGELPLEAAERELKEELGIRASEWMALGFFDLDTSIIQCPVYLFVAKDLTFIATDREGTETIEALTIPFQSAVQKVIESEMSHGPSSVLILKADALRREGGLAMGGS